MDYRCALGESGSRNIRGFSVIPTLSGRLSGSLREDDTGKIDRGATTSSQDSGFVSSGSTLDIERKYGPKDWQQLSSPNLGFNREGEIPARASRQPGATGGSGDSTESCPGAHIRRRTLSLTNLPGNGDQEKGGDQDVFREGDNLFRSSSVDCGGVKGLQLTRAGRLGRQQKRFSNSCSPIGELEVLGEAAVSSKNVSCLPVDVALPLSGRPASYRDGSSPGVGLVTEPTPANRPPDYDVLLIRQILSVASLCVPLPVPSTSTERGEGPRHSACASSGQVLIPELQTVSLNADSELDNCNHLRSTYFIRKLTLEKNDFLEAFERMCGEAKKLGLDVVGRTVQISNFSAAKLDSRGGYLSVAELGVHLYVPPGAVRDGVEPQTVYIFVQGNLNVNSKSLTPCVHCGPSSLRFSKDVILTFPHCAKDATDYPFTCVKSTTGGSLREIQAGRDGVVLVDRESVSVTMSHFCGYSASAPVRTKFMLACVFIREDENEVQIRVRVFDNSTANLREVENKEQRNGFILADTVNALEVQRTGKDVHVVLKSTAKAWKITHPETGRQTFQHSYLWRDNNPDLVPTFPSNLFYASRRGWGSFPFEGRMEVFQEGRQSYGAAFFVKRPKANAYGRNDAQGESDHSGEDVKVVIQRLMLDQLRTVCSCDAVRTNIRCLDEVTFSRLCDNLDRKNPVDADWRLLPEYLFEGGDPAYCGGWVWDVNDRAEKERRSPTELVLDTFFAKSKRAGMDTVATLKRLRQALLVMKKVRHDVQFAIDAINEQLKRRKSTPNQAASDPDPNNNERARPVPFIYDPFAGPDLTKGEVGTKKKLSHRFSLPADFQMNV